MSDVSPGRRAEVTRRAGERREHCRLSQLGQEAAFHVDHIVPRAAGGTDAIENLALACVSCSLRKWVEPTAVDPESGEPAPLFHPRSHIWAEHFRWRGETIEALTPTGRATMAARAMNRLLILAIRREESARGRNPSA